MQDNTQNTDTQQSDLPPAKTFATIAEIVNDQHFQSFVKQNLDELHKDRRNRPAAPQGFKYKRDWYDIMPYENRTFDFFIKNIEQIWSKTSKLSRMERDVIRIVCDKSLTQTVIAYSSIK